MDLDGRDVRAYADGRCDRTDFFNIIYNRQDFGETVYIPPADEEVLP